MSFFLREKLEYRQKGYRVVRRMQGGGASLQRTSSRAWELFDKLDSFKPSTGGRFMYLFMKDGELWFSDKFPTKKKVTLISEGNKADLWPMFLDYARLMGANVAEPKGDQDGDA